MPIREREIRPTRTRGLKIKLMPTRERGMTIILGEIIGVDTMAEIIVGRIIGDTRLDVHYSR
jgi:hypothetical protein